MLYVQEEAAERTLEMLYGAMDELSLGDPWQLSTDVGPAIDARAKVGIAAYVDGFREAGTVLKELATPEGGTFVAPTVLKVTGIADLLTPVLAAYQEAHPKVVIRFLTDMRVFRLDYGEAHVAIRAGEAPQEPVRIILHGVRARAGVDDHIRISSIRPKRPGHRRSAQSADKAHDRKNRSDI